MNEITEMLIASEAEPFTTTLVRSKSANSLCRHSINFLTHSIQEDEIIVVSESDFKPQTDFCRKCSKRQFSAPVGADNVELQGNA